MTSILNATPPPGKIKPFTDERGYSVGRGGGGAHRRAGSGQAPPAVWGAGSGAWLMALTKNDAIWARVTGWSGQ